MDVAIAEIKARCRNSEAALERMRSFGAVHQGSDHQVDTYFAVSRGRLKLRQGTIETTLIHYERDDRAGPKDSQVLVHTPSDGQSLKATLSAALDLLVVVDKQREILWADNVKLHVDQVAGLGAFVEIEAMDGEDARSRTELRVQCRRWLNRLEIGPELLVTGSYSDLLLDRSACR